MNAAPNPSNELDASRVMPVGLNNAYLFAVMNALSFQVVLNSPMVLYAKQLGASATELGIITGMMPLLVIFQIPAAQYINRVGYRRFVYAGWGTRVSFIFGMALVPLSGAFLPPRTQLSLLLLLLFGFNLSRGISSAAWMPWIASLVPEQVRGKYIARDAACVNLSSFISFILAAGCLGKNPSAWQFSILFAFSACMGAVSLSFLKKIPDVPTPDEVRGSKMPVPWLELIKFRPYRKLVAMAMSWSIVYGGMTAFTVAFLKSEAGISEGRILMLTSVSFLGGLSSLALLGSRLDGVGSKPVLSFAFGIWVVVLIGWILLAGRFIGASLSVVLGLQFTMGLCASMVSMANTRLAMAIVPVMGRNHFFALFSVLTCLALGLSPIGWGILIDFIGESQIQYGGMNWNRYSLFFALVLVALMLTIILARRLEEPKAASLETLLREILVQSPQRFWMRFWPRN